MRTSSAKNKGRRLVAKVRELLLSWAPDLAEQDLVIMPTSVPGVDLRMSARAEAIYPFSIECKNTEKINIWACLKQTHANTKEGTIPLLVFSRNHQEPQVCLSLEHFLRLTR